MRIAFSAAIIASAAVGSASAFTSAAGGPRWGSGGALFSTVEDASSVSSAAATSAAAPAPAIEHGDQDPVVHVVNVGADDAQPEEARPADVAVAATFSSLSSLDVKARLDAQLARLREKDASSTQLQSEDIQVVFEDDHIVIVNKPSGVLTVSPNNEFPSLAQAVCDLVKSDLASADRMVVHRLGMDTSGLIVLAKTKEAVRGMHAAFRNRAIERKYEALVCGVVANEQGFVDLPIMRDYECPPYVRISTDAHQRALVGLDADVVGKKLLELPKASLTKYQVVAREEFDGQPVTRVSLTSLSGRYHQLNVHMAAFGHPVVGDATYGIDGLAASNGGLSDAELEALVPNPNRASVELQRAVAKAATVPCVHAKSLKFRHPVTDDEVSLTCDAPW